MINKKLYKKMKIIFRAIERATITGNDYIYMRSAKVKTQAYADKILEKTKKKYADVLPLEYWNLIDALAIKVFIRRGEAQTISEAINLSKKYNYPNPFRGWDS